MNLKWKRGDAGLEAHADGRRIFAVNKTRTGWYLCRYSIKLDGTVLFKSRESVRSQRNGRAYADRLWQLSGGRR